MKKKLVSHHSASTSSSKQVVLPAFSHGEKNDSFYFGAAPDKYKDARNTIDEEDLACSTKIKGIQQAHNFIKKRMLIGQKVDLSTENVDGTEKPKRTSFVSSSNKLMSRSMVPPQLPSQHPISWFSIIIIIIIIFIILCDFIFF
jgi:hypothetical protein